MTVLVAFSGGREPACNLRLPDGPSRNLQQSGRSPDGVQADRAEGARFSRFTKSLFNALRYAFTDATIVSVSAP
jgi:hypothetical protein